MVKRALAGRGRKLAPAALLVAMLPLAAAGADTFRVVVGTAAEAGEEATVDSHFPPVSDTGFVAIGPLPDSLSNTQTTSASAGAASAEGSASGQAELTAPGGFDGVVLRSVSTSEAVAPFDPFVGRSGFALANSRVQYLDMLTPTGLPFGTPVTFRVSLELDGVMARVGTPSPNHVQLTFADGGTPGAPIDQLVCSNLSGPCSLSDTGEFLASAGVEYGVSVELGTQVQASASTGADAFASASSDFSSTARVCIDIITPGTGYTLESGGDLRCSPEPPLVPVLPPLALGALALALGVAGQIALRRRS